MKNEETALSKLKSFLEADLVRRSAKEAAAMISRDISWYGTSDAEDINGIEEAEAYLENEIAQSPEPYTVEYLTERENMRSPDFGTAFVKCRITGGAVTMLCRCSASAFREDGELKLYALHMSVPDSIQQEGEYFPFSLTEQYEKELHEEFFDEMVDGGVLGRYCEPTTQIYVVNRQLLDFLGYPSEEVFRRETNNSADSTIYEEDREPGYEQIKRQLEHGQRYHIEYRMLRRDGSAVWVESHGKIVITKDGRHALVGIVNDISARKDAERKLLESEQRYRFAIEGAGLKIWEYDFKNRMVTLPENGGGSGGESFETEHFSQACGIGFSNEQIRKMKEMFARMEQGEQKASEDFWVENPETHTRWCERVTFSVFQDSEGHPDKAYGASFDVTKSKLAEKRYQEELAYRDSVAETVVSSSCVNLSKRVVETMRVGGETLPENMCKNMVDYKERSQLFLVESEMTQEQNNRFSPDALISAFNDGVTVVSEEFLALLAPKRYGWLRSEVNIIKHPDTGDILAFFYNRDLTDQLIRSSLMDTILTKYYQEAGIVDLRTGTYSMSAGGGSIIQDADGCDYNSNVCRFLEHRVVPAERERLAEQLSINYIRKRLDSADVFELQFLGLSASGEERYFLLRFQYLVENRQVLLITRQDIDELVRSEQKKQKQLELAVAEANKANKIKSEFLSRMSHEIRTPLNAIIGLAQLGRANLKGPNPDVSEGLTYVENTLDSSHYLLSIINDILDMSKIESGEICLVLDNMDCRHILAGVGTIIGTQAAAKNVRFEVIKHSNCPENVVGDATRVEQILVNLLSNAVKFTPEGGLVQLIIEKADEQDDSVNMRFTVSDTGIGISEDFAPRVFEPFSQEYAGITSSYGGSGLGLSIARQLARMMGGDITVKSKKGEGSVFTAMMCFGIPRGKQHTHEEPEQCMDHSRLKGRRILVCEDHPLNIMVIKRLLEKKGCAVDVAQNGAEGVEAFEKSAPGWYDAVLMDIRMPVMDGLNAARIIRGLERPDAAQVPIIAMTANAYEEDIRLSIEAGMNAHLAKPIEPELLFATIARYLTGNER